MINNRQNGRRRGRGNGGNNGQRGGNPGRPDSGNRIDSRARGNANQLYEKYKNLARDSQMSGDRVNTEYYLQFADHYFRVLSESRARFEEQNPNAAPQRRIQPVDSFDDFFGDDEYGDEGEPVRAGEQSGAPQPPRSEGQRGQGQYQGGQHQGGQYQGGQYQNAYQGQRDERRPRDEGRRDDHREGDRRPEMASLPRGEADERPRRDRDDRPGRDRDDRSGRDRDDRYAMTGSPVANDLGEDSPDGSEPTPIAPRRRGRPPRAAAPEGEAPAALEADRLPPSLSLANPPVDEAEDAPKPRRRRVRAAGGEASQAG